MADVPVVDYDPYNDPIGDQISKNQYDPLYRNIDTYRLFDAMSKVNFNEEGLKKLLQDTPSGNIEDRRKDTASLDLTDLEKYQLGVYLLSRKNMPAKSDNPLAVELGYNEAPTAVPDATPILPGQ